MDLHWFKSTPYLGLSLENVKVYWLDKLGRKSDKYLVKNRFRMDFVRGCGVRILGERFWE